MTSNIFDGTGWVHVEGHGWLYRQGDGHLYSHTAEKWVYLPHLLTPEGVLTEPPPIPTQAKARHAVGRAATRLTSGPVLPLTPRQPLVGRLPRTPNDDRRARPFITMAPRPPAPEPVYADDNLAHAHGWPTWEDAWGYKDMRPGGAIRALLRGYTRAWMYVVLPICLLTAFGGGDAFAGGLIAAIALGVRCWPSACHCSTSCGATTSTRQRATPCCLLSPQS